MIFYYIISILFSDIKSIALMINLYCFIIYVYILGFKVF